MSGAATAKITELQQRYDAIKAKNLSLDMTRGKPCAEQLDLALPMLDCLGRDHKAADGTDCRNYGGLDGIAEAKALFAEFLEVNTDELLIGGNSSLNLMHDTVARAMSHGIAGGASWSSLPTVKFICPSPGYDRHFSVCAHYGIEMITVDNNDDGPDMDQVEKLLTEDDSIKGMWIVPKYGNPTGGTVSDAVVDRLAAMKVKANDFRIFWDNAYTVHHLTDTHDHLKNIMQACKEANNADRVLIYGSTSKISFAGAGISVMGASPSNITWMKSHLSMQTIGPDKLNQLRHVRFFKDMAGIHAHMEKHAALIKPKFDAVLEILEAELGDKNIATWSNPNGGYFISLDTPDNCAKKVVAMAKEAGAKLTSAGATFPNGNDPRDRNIRIAPTLPSLDEIKQATELLCICIQIAAAQSQ